MNTVLEKIQEYKLYEQLILLCSREDSSKEVDEYIQKLIYNPKMNWDMFLGIVLNNRINGVVYTKIIKFDKVPKYIRFYLKTIYDEQAKRIKKHIDEIQKINKQFSQEGIHYSFLKGAYMNTFIYKLGQRISNDTDIMVSPEDLKKCSKILEADGYVQGKMSKGNFYPATKKEILFARMNTYEIVPYIKLLDDEHFPYHEVDINFKLSNDENDGISKKMLSTLIDVRNEEYSLKIMNYENFLIYLCVHLYREATMVFKIMSGGDLTMYKFMDIHFFISKLKKEINWKKVLEYAKELRKVNDVYYSLFYVEKLYPGTLDKSVLDIFKPENTDFLNQYKGRDNTNEVYTWDSDFKDRVFDSLHKLEAMKNVSQEYERFNDILKKMK